jgi:predicted amidohydrolase
MLPSDYQAYKVCVAQVPLVASNRVGTEKADDTSITFYGGSFIAGPTGEIRQQVTLNFRAFCELMMDNLHTFSSAFRLWGNA